MVPSRRVVGLLEQPLQNTLQPDDQCDEGDPGPDESRKLGCFPMGRVLSPGPPMECDQPP